MSETRISPQAFIGEGVNLGARVTIGPGAVLLGPCTVEDDVFIGAGALIGSPPEMTDQAQNAAWAGEFAHSGVLIQRGAVIREGVVIHQGSYRPTTVGENSWVLNRAYLAHDVSLGNNSIVSAGVSIGGHCLIGGHVTIGMNASIHQRTFIGDGCMIGMATPLARDLPPFVKAYGSPARIRDVNRIGMRRLGVNEQEIATLQAAYAAGNLLLENAPAFKQESLARAVTEWLAREGRRTTQADFSTGKETNTRKPAQQ